VGDAASSIPVKVEVDEEDKSAVIVIPWHQLSRVSRDDFHAWFAKAEKVRAEWVAKGYRCN
jgi:hypothetical protein